MRRITVVLLLFASVITTGVGPRAAAANGLVACGGGGATPTAPPSTSSPAAAPASPPATPPLRPVADLPLPGGATRFDYQQFDPASGRLYVAHMGDGALLVIDVATHTVVGSVAGLPGVTGVLALPDLGKIYASVTGDQRVAAIDAKTLAVSARLGSIGFPDGLAYAPSSHQVFVSDESGGGELVIDANTDRIVTTIDLGGTAGNTHFDPGSGCVLVAVQTRDELAAIDPTTDSIAARYPLDPDCQGPHGFLIDAPRRLAFVTCEENAKLFVVDLTAMRVTGTFPVGDGPDVQALDPGLGRLYVASESGTVSVFDERGGGLASAGDYRAPHAHSVAVDPATHLVYLPLENVNGKPVLRIMSPPPATS